MQYFFFGGGGVARQGCPNLRYFAFLPSASFSWLPPVPLAPFRFPWGGEGRSQPPVLCIPGLRMRFFFLASSVPLTCDAQTYFRSSLLFGGREATTGNTSALRKLSQATVLLALFRLRNSAKYLIQWAFEIKSAILEKGQISEIKH